MPPIALIGFTVQLIHDKRAALDAASQQLSLIADNTALTLKDKTLSSSANWQGALADSLPKGAMADGRTVLLADAEGQVQGRAPLDGSRSGNLLTILGPQQPLTTFGAEAGVLRLTLQDGTDAIVTVRNVPQTDAQLAFIQPVGGALADWRRDRQPRDHAPRLDRLGAGAAGGWTLVSHPHGGARGPRFLDQRS